MQTKLIEVYQQSPLGEEAEAILRSCVHCGFCNATCPTYQELGNELDGPRGRIYLIKQLLEGADVGEATQKHLDRCLSCRACETTCPSGVKYHRLLDIGRHLLQDSPSQGKARSPLNSLIRSSYAWILGQPRLFAWSLALGRRMRPLLPSRLGNKIPPLSDQFSGLSIPQGDSSRNILSVAGCVQDALAPDINRATQYVFARFGFRVHETAASECCGAMNFHLGQEAQARKQIEKNIHHWWALHEKHQFDGIMVNASGCGLFVKEYPELLQDDPALLAKAHSLQSLVKDPVELLESEDWSRFDWCDQGSAQAIAFHPPCTLQHGQKLNGRVENLLTRLGVKLVDFSDKHLCCGSAGTYSLLQPALSNQLKQNKWAHIDDAGAQRVLTANVGCQSHLATGSDLPVQHWLEFVAEMLTGARSG